MKQIFVSSVQKEFERERSAIKRMIESDPILKPYFKTFVFDVDVPVSEETAFFYAKDELHVLNSRLEEVLARFRVVIWRPVAMANRGANRGANLLNDLPTEQRKICSKLLKDPRLSSRALSNELGIRRNTVLRQLESLKAKGILVRRGGTRGFWEIRAQ